MEKRESACPAAALAKESRDAKPTQSTGNAIPEGSEGANPLSEREMEVSRLLVTGATNSEIARELTISPHTVKVHLRNVFEKLQVSSRTEASMVLLQRGWVIVPGVEMPGDRPREIPRVEMPDRDRESRAATIPALPPLPARGSASWQRIYLSLALAFCLIAAFAPFVLGRPRTAFTLLSDAGQTAIGKPSVELLPRWEARTPMSQARSRMAVVMDQEWIYILGGEGRGGRPLGAVDAYHLQDNLWQTLPPLPRALTNSAAVLVDEGLYVAGGSTPTADWEPTQPLELELSDALLRYDTQGRFWETVGRLPVPLAGAQLVAHEEKLYLLGGWDGQAMRGEVWSRSLPQAARAEDSAQADIPQADEVQASAENATADVEADIEVDAWQVVTRLPAPMAFFGAAWVDDTLYVAGGYDGQNELDAVYIYRTHETLADANTWQPLAPLSAPRGGVTLAYDGVALLALGGGWTGLIADHERYDASINQWTTFASPISGEWRHLAAVSRDGVIHLLGGWSGDYLDIHLQYQSSFRALLPVITND